MKSDSIPLPEVSGDDVKAKEKPDKVNFSI